jgi:hypothetical protein
MNGYNVTMGGQRNEHRSTFTFDPNLGDLPSFVGTYIYILMKSMCSEMILLFFF